MPTRPPPLTSETDPAYTAGGATDLELAAAVAALSVVSRGDPTYQTLLGSGAGGNITPTAIWTTLLGSGAGQAITTATGCTAVGTSALKNNQTGLSNSAFGAFSLQSATSTGNSAFGVDCLCGGVAGTEMSGPSNSGFGQNALSNNTTGHENNAFGVDSLKANTTGQDNAAFGFSALSGLVTASRNSGLGNYAGYLLTSSDNVVVGYSAGGGVIGGSPSTTGTKQTLVGTGSGQASSTQRDDVTALGYKARVDGNGALALGSGTLAGAAGSVALGRDSGGNPASTSTANEIKVGTSNHTVNITGLLTLGGVTPVAGDYLTIGKAGGFGMRLIDTTSVTGGATRIGHIGRVTSFDYYDVAGAFAGTFMTMDGANGLKVAPFASQKLGFYGATPIVQPTATPAAATDLATALTLVNYLRTKALALGLVA